MVEPIYDDYEPDIFDELAAWIVRKARRLRLGFREHFICRKQGHHLKMDAMHCLRCGAKTW